MNKSKKKKKNKLTKKLKMAIIERLKKVICDRIDQLQSVEDRLEKKLNNKKYVLKFKKAKKPVDKSKE